MKAVLRLEIIGDDYYAHQRQKDAKGGHRYEKYQERFGADKVHPWIARIVGLCPKYGFKREFLSGQKDYSLANSIGSRGVYEYFVLDPGIYEVHERITWKRSRRYFIRVDGCDIIEISKEDAKNEENWATN